MPIITRLLEILFKKDFEYSELFNGLVLFSWGVWFVLMDPFNSRAAAAYKAMSNQAPEWFWSLAFLVIGGLKLFGLFNEIWRLRLIVSMVAFIWWFYIFLLFVFTEVATFAVPTTLMFSLSAAWGHVRLAALRHLYEH